MRDKTQKPQLEPGSYRHFKGGIYEVVDVIPDWSKGCEDEWKVLYKSSLGELGVRAYSEFVDAVYRNGESVPRFERIEEDKS